MPNTSNGELIRSAQSTFAAFQSGPQPFGYFAADRWIIGVASSMQLSPQSINESPELVVKTEKHFPILLSGGRQKVGAATGLDRRPCELVLPHALHTSARMSAWVANAPKLLSRGPFLLVGKLAVMEFVTSAARLDLADESRSLVDAYRHGAGVLALSSSSLVSFRLGRLSKGRVKPDLAALMKKASIAATADAIVAAADGDTGPIIHLVSRLHGNPLTVEDYVEVRVLARRGIGDSAHNEAGRQWLESDEGQRWMDQGISDSLACLGSLIEKSVHGAEPNLVKISLDLF